MRENKIANIKVDKSKVAKIGSFILTTMLIISFVDGTYEKNTNNEVTTIGCEPKAVEYYDRLYELKKNSSKYDDVIVDLYNKGQLSINGVSYPLDKYFITINFNSEGNEYHLTSTKSDYNDILTSSLEKYEYKRIVRFRDTTAFIELINSDCVLIDYERNIITIIDVNKALEIVNNWDGTIHDKVPETDAVENKEFIRR
jgi:hypothetical protein